jgi:hypothetical protein
MNTARHALAILVLLTYPPAVLLWLAIHPWARQWRRIGTVATYLALSVPMLAIVIWLFRERVVLLGRDLGTSWSLVALGVASLGCAGSIARQRMKHLRFSTLSGKPELSQSAYRGSC